MIHSQICTFVKQYLIQYLILTCLTAKYLYIDGIPNITWTLFTYKCLNTKTKLTFYYLLIIYDIEIILNVQKS